MTADASPSWLVEPAAFVKTEFDYLVVGGGTAGVALASRLAEDVNCKVGVIEAGPYRPDDPMINIPINWSRLLPDMSYSWQITTSPQEHAEKRSIYLPSGKLLGGSSAVNLMAFMRASKIDYDNWEALGNPGWNWEGLLPYFKKAEHYFSPTPEITFPGVTPSDEANARELEHIYHGTQGPLHVTYNETYDPLIHPAIKALNTLGIPTNYTPEHGNATGVSNVPRTLKYPEKERLYSVNTYLAAVGGQGNISVVTEAYVKKIVFSDDSKLGLVATGLEFVFKEQSFTASATKEVILSAGAFKTPQLLELSGIGDAKLLSAYDIPCLVDLPQVGENYQDHLNAVSSFEMKPDHPEYPLTTSDPGFTFSALSFFPLQTIISDEVLASMVQRLDQDLESSGASPLQKAQFKLQRSSSHPDLGSGEILVIGGQPAQEKHFLILVGAAQHPYSRGHVHIESKDPFANPSVNPHCLEIKFDVEVLSRITQFCRKITETGPLKSHLVAPVFPPASIQPGDDDAYETFCRQTTQTIYHAIGTAAMAPRELGGVVDASLRVYGTSNLRVVDASIIPLHIGGHPQATVYAIAEKAADIIKSGQ